MPTDVCPRCRTETDLRATLSRAEVTDPDGTTREVVVRTYHCATCHCFVRSERVHAAEQQADP